MKRYFLINSVVVTFLACCQSNPAGEADSKANQTKGWEHLTATEYEISYPSVWQLDLSKNAGTTFILFGRSATEGKFRENINLLVQDLRGLNFDLNQYVALSEQQIGTMVLDSKLIESKRKKTSNDEHHEIIYEGVQGPFRLKWKQYYWMVQDKAYVLTFTGTQDTYDDFIKTADKILDSFKLKDMSDYKLMQHVDQGPVKVNSKLLADRNSGITFISMSWLRGRMLPGRKSFSFFSRSISIH